MLFEVKAPVVERLVEILLEGLTPDTLTVGPAGLFPGLYLRLDPGDHDREAAGRVGLEHLDDLLRVLGVDAENRPHPYFAEDVVVQLEGFLAFGAQGVDVFVGPFEQSEGGGRVFDC